MIQPRPRTELEQDRSIGVQTGLTIDTPAWMLDAACRGTDNPDLFYPEESNGNTPARNVCAYCFVRVDCLAYALENREPYGVWGGESANSRHAILRRRQENVA